MKHLLSFQLFESRVQSKRPISESGKLLATNQCGYFYSHDDTATDYNLKRIARIYLDKDETLWMDIREEGTVESPYINKSEWERSEELWFGKVGTLNKPDLQKVTGLLKPETGQSAHSQNYQGGYGYFKQRFASQFSPSGWRTPESEDKGLLSEILSKYKSGVVKEKQPEQERNIKSRDEMIEDIGIKVQQMSDEQLQQLLSRLGMSGTPKPSKPSVEGKSPEIVQYGEKAFAVFGDTRDKKDELLHLGGRFNRFLTNPKTQQRESGWIFPNAKKVAVEDVLK